MFTFENQIYTIVKLRVRHVFLYCEQIIQQNIWRLAPWGPSESRVLQFNLLRFYSRKNKMIHLEVQGKTLQFSSKSSIFIWILPVQRISIDCGKEHLKSFHSPPSWAQMLKLFRFYYTITASISIKSMWQNRLKVEKHVTHKSMILLYETKKISKQAKIFVISFANQ